jgi:hypothetical protein
VPADHADHTDGIFFATKGRKERKEITFTAIDANFAN